MITKKKDAVERVEEIKKVFNPLLGRTIRMEFDMHCFDGIRIVDIVLASVGNPDVKFEKRQDVTGKNRSPMVFEMITNQGELRFALDDIQVVSLGWDKARAVIKQSKGKDLVITFAAI